MAHPYWPFFDLRVRTPRVELRPACSVEDLTALAARAAAGIHPPEFMPFSMPWSDAPSPDLERGAMQHFWSVWGRFAADKWVVPFAVVVDDEVAGVQAVMSESFAVLRTVGTGSWLGQAYQGKGIGKEMRAAALHFAFAGLGAVRAETAAYDDNAQSIDVTRSLGYAENGDDVALRRGEAGRQVRFVMDRALWESRRRDDIEIAGLEECLPLFGLSADLSPAAPQG